MVRRRGPAPHLWVLTFIDVTGERVPMVDQFGMRAFFTRKLADKECARCRQEDRDEGCITDVRVMKYLPEATR